MSIRFSSSQAFFRIAYREPSRLVSRLITGWFILLLIWAIAARVPLIVATEAVEIQANGIIVATFDSGDALELGQEARVELFGQEQDALPAEVILLDDKEVASLQILDTEAAKALISNNSIVERVEVVIDMLSPLQWVVASLG